MDCAKVGNVIRALRREKGLTQLALSEMLHVSDKAVSKWERGIGCPDVSLISELSRILGVQPDALLCGRLDLNDPEGGNMKKLRFYVCPECGNVLTAAAESAVYCCGKKCEALTPVKAEEAERLRVEKMDNEWFVSSDHEMTKEHYISFVALLTGDALLLRRLYPEWDMQTRIPCISHGTLLWYCVQDGLFFQYI